MYKPSKNLESLSGIVFSNCIIFIMFVTTMVACMKIDQCLNLV
jgi:hypothetical protein